MALIFFDILLLALVRLLLALIVLLEALIKLLLALVELLISPPRDPPRSCSCPVCRDLSDDYSIVVHAPIV